MNALLEYEQYMPHGMCLLWEPWLVILWAGSDLLIFVAYMLIPLALLMVLRRRPDIRHRGLVSLFAAFILLCGITHAMSIVTLWTAIYPLMGTVKLLTGLVSIATAIALFRLVPALVRIPTPERHDEVIEALRVTMAELTKARDELEDRVEQRTRESESANLRLAVVARDAVQRSRNLIQVVSSLTQPGIAIDKLPSGFLTELRGRINALAIATSTVMEQTDQSTARLRRVIERQIGPLFPDPASQLHMDGPTINIGAQGAQQISLAVWELASRLVDRTNPSDKAPVIKITWTICNRDPENPRVTIEWREATGKEDAFGAIEIPRHSTFTPVELSKFADILLSRIVPKMLGGTGEYETTEDSFVYRLECNLAALTDVDNSEVSEALAEASLE